MTMAKENKWSTRNYDIAKGAVLLVVLVLVALAFATSPNAASDQQKAQPVGLAQSQQQAGPVGPTQSQPLQPLESVASVLGPPQTAADGSVSLSGRAKSGSTVELWAGQIKLAAVPVDADGKWSYAGKLDPGDYQIVARTVSPEGQVLNESRAVVVHIEAATPMPSITVVRIGSPKVDPDGAVSLSGSGEPGSTVELWAGAIKLTAVPVDADGQWSYAGQLDPGEYMIVARTVSAEGLVLNESQAVAVSVSVASAVPVTIKEPQVDASGEVTLSGSGKPGSTLEILDNGVVVATAVVSEDGTWTVHYAASAGEHTLTVQVQGQAVEGSAVASVAVTGPAAAGGQSYVVKNGDWLIHLARRYYGDSSRWIDIYEATNAKAAQDPSYHRIGDPNYLRPGWKLWIPEP